MPGAPVAVAEPAAADGLPAEQRAAVTVLGLVEAEPAAPVVDAPLCVVAAPVASALVAVPSDAPAFAAFAFAAAARAGIEPAVAQQHAVAAVTELLVDGQPLFAPVVADVSSAADPADEPVGPLVAPLPGRSRLELFAGPIAVSATPAFAGARFGRPVPPVLPARPSVARAPALPQGWAVESFERLRADRRSGASGSSLDHLVARLATRAQDHV